MGMRLITREELRVELERGPGPRLVMTLSAFDYEVKHIPGSVWFDTVDDMLAKLDRAEEIVVYCGGVYCAESIRAYYRLEREGFSVRRFAGGIPDWEDAGYPLSRARP
jgi:3-mercaptopyruvate sulfurtransferase SseA